MSDSGRGRSVNGLLPAASSKACWSDEPAAAEPQGTAAALPGPPAGDAGAPTASVPRPSMPPPVSLLQQWGADPGDAGGLDASPATEASPARFSPAKEATPPRGPLAGLGNLFGSRSETRSDGHRPRPVGVSRIPIEAINISPTAVAAEDDEPDAVAQPEGGPCAVTPKALNFNPDSFKPPKPQSARSKSSFSGALSRAASAMKASLPSPRAPSLSSLSLPSPRGRAPSPSPAETLSKQQLAAHPNQDVNIVWHRKRTWRRKEGALGSVVFSY